MYETKGHQYTINGFYKTGIGDTFATFFSHRIYD